MKLEAHVVLYGNQIGFWYLEGILWNVTQVGQSCLHSLAVLLLGILLNFGKGLGAVEDAQSLKSLLKDLTVVRCETQWISIEV